MLCDSCRKGHATYEHPIFVGTKMVRVHLCNDCFASKNAEAQLSKIKSTKDHAQKTAAVEEFLKSIGKKY